MMAGIKSSELAWTKCRRAAERRGIMAFTRPAIMSSAVICKVTSSSQPGVELRRWLVVMGVGYLGFPSLGLIQEAAEFSDFRFGELGLRMAEVSGHGLLQ